MSSPAPSPELGAKVGSAFDVYEPLKEAGRGNFSTVQVARPRVLPSPLGVTQVAIKTVPKSDTHKLDVLRKEWAALRAGYHDNIICAYEYYENDTEASMVLEFAPHGHLLEWLVEASPISEKEVCSVIHQLLSALAYIHGNGFVHRDVKPHNILVVQRKPLIVRLADFGLVKKCGSSAFWARQNSAGDFDIMSPDMRDRMEDASPVTAEEYQKSDMYAVGVTMYYLLSGKAPFAEGVDPRFNSGDPWFLPDSETFPGVSSEAIELVKRLMHLQNWERPEAAEALDHPWFGLFRQQSSTSNMLGAGSGQPSASGDLNASDSDDEEGKPEAVDNDGESLLLVRHITSYSETSFATMPTSETVVSNFGGKVPEDEEQPAGEAE